MKKKIKLATLATILVIALVLSGVSVLADQTPISVALTSAPGTIGYYTNVFFTMGANSGLGAGSFTVTYDPLKLESLYPQGAIDQGAGGIISAQAALINPITEAPIGGSSSLFANITTPGTIQVSVINTVGFIPGGNLFKMRFKLLDGATGNIPINVTVNTFVAATVGNVAIPYTIASQGIISGPTPTPIIASVPSAVTLTKAALPSVNKFAVSVADFNPAYSYQVWAYQTMTSDIFNGNTINANYWKLVLPYKSGNLFSLSGSIGTTEISEFPSMDGNYTISVRIVDENGIFVEQLKDTFTDADVQVVKITKILVDGKVSFDSTVVREIKAGASVEFDVIANLLSGTTYSATTSPSSDLIQTGSKFVWDISGLEPGAYSVNLGAGADKKVVSVELYKAGTASAYAQISDVTFGVRTPAGLYWNYAFTPAFDVYSDKKFRYSIGESMRSPIYTSGLISASTATLAVSDENIEQTAYGVYQLVSMIGKANGTVEDGIVKTIVNKRTGADSTLSVITEGTLTIPNSVTITATATIPDVSSLDIEYSFWRRDAKGWVMVRDYAKGIDSNILGWKPSRIGDYTIQVRAKGPGAMSYEVAKNVDISIGGGLKASGTVDSINISTLTVRARTPIGITPTIISSDTDLMYKYIISNSFLYNVETAYSVDPNYLWVPGKAGSYRVQVLVKNSESFGKYDFAKSFNIVVVN
jgi:hypothetical protein